MQAYAVLMQPLMLIYCLAQTYQNLLRRNWDFAAWGGGMILFFGWMIEALTRGPFC